LTQTRRHIPGVVAKPMMIALAMLSCSVLRVMAQTPQAAQAGQGNETSQPDAEVLDRVVAVVNNEVILASDLDLEMRVSRLLPVTSEGDTTRAGALERLTTRALIEQQIVQEDPHGLDIAPNELEASLTELRQSLPGCKVRDCATPAGWSAYLATFGLTPERVAEYWARRMAMLRFIELRFRSGIRITPEEIKTFYDETMVPQYRRREDAPPLERVSARIQEILLQRKVNALLSDWLKSLQDQGQVEILDPTLQEQTPAAGGLAASPGQADDSSAEKGGRR